MPSLVVLVSEMDGGVEEKEIGMQDSTKPLLRFFKVRGGIGWSEQRGL